MLDFRRTYTIMSTLRKYMCSEQECAEVARAGEAASGGARRFRVCLGVVAVALVVAFSAGCGAHSVSVPITVAFTPGFTPPTEMTVSEQCGIAATVSNDNKNQGVTWTATCESANCGTFTPVGTSGSGVPITYTSPATAPTGDTVTVTATSVTDPTKKAVSPAITIGTSSAGCTAP